MTIAALTAVSVAIVPTLTHAYTGKKFIVGKYADEHPGEGRCCSGCADLDGVWDDADHFEEALYDIGYTTVYETTNNGTQAKDFTDRDRFDWGRDYSNPYGSDWATVVLFAGHGGCKDNLSDGFDNGCGDSTYWRSYPIMGSDDDTCYPQTANSAGGNGHILLGGGYSTSNTRAVIFASCQSMRRDVWNAGGYGRMDGPGLRMVMGFHGSMKDDGGGSRFDTYINDAEDNYIGDDFLDDFFISDGNTDQCPAVLVWGSSGTNTDFQFDWGGFTDWKDVGTHTMSTYYYIKGCDPAYGPALPN